MPQPFGPTVKFTLSLSRPWLRLGPGWAALAGALSTGQVELNLPILLKLLSLWLLVDPILGMLWDLSVRQDLWREIARANLGPPTTFGLSLPYVKPDSLAGRFLLQLRRYQAWWRETYWPEFGHKFATFWSGSAIALLIGFFLAPAVFWLTLLAITLMILAGLGSTELTTPQGGRLKSLVQFLLPWSMGAVLWSPLSLISLLLAICYWITYLGGLRMLGNHHRAEALFFLGQIAAIALLLGLRLLPGAAILSVLLVTQRIIKAKFNLSSEFLQKTQTYLVIVVIAAGFSLGSL